MATVIAVPTDWNTVAVQYPLFMEHPHVLQVQSVKLVDVTRVLVKWKGVKGDELENRVVSETFDLTQRRDKQRFKDFLFAVACQPQNKTVDLDACRGKVVEVLAVQRTSGHGCRWDILHHALSWEPQNQEPSCRQEMRMLSTETGY